MVARVAAKFSYIVTLFMVTLLTAQYKNPQKALIVVPVADLLGSPVKHYFPHVKTENAYHSLPLNRGLSSPSLECPRLHQALLHETVYIIEERGNEALITMPNALYLSSGSLKNEYWIQKNALISYDTLKKGAADMTKIPSPLHELQESGTIVTLIAPFNDKERNCIYSVGTRFVVDKTQSNEHEVSAYVFNAHKNDFDRVLIPLSIIYSQDTSTTERPEVFQDKKTAHYVATIKKWAQATSGFIPYVWGGCSYTHTSNSQFKESFLAKNGIARSYVSLDDFFHAPKTGFDCSNLILRATQIAGIPYYYKNSSAAAQYLKQLNATETIEIGDIIWIPGHVMIVSDVAHNLLLEARGYNHGYGKIQEIALGKVFKNMQSYDDLARAFHTKQKLYRLDSKGAIADSFHQFKILKMKSVWQK